MYINCVKYYKFRLFNNSLKLVVLLLYGSFHICAINGVAIALSYCYVFINIIETLCSY